MYEMLAGKSPFDIVGASDNPDCNTEDFLFQGLCVMEEKVDGSVLKFSIDLQTNANVKFILLTWTSSYLWSFLYSNLVLLLFEW